MEKSITKAKVNTRDSDALSKVFYMADITCEICGEREAAAIVLIEGAKMAACRGCARGGKLIYRLEETETRGSEVIVKEYRAPIEQEEIVDDYAERVRKAIEKEKLPLEVIAERISERESYLNSIEKGKMVPTVMVARKLEKELGIKLVEMVKENVVSTSEKSGGKFKEPTLADILDSQKKKKEK